MISQTTRKLTPPHGRAVLLGSLTLLLSPQVPLPNKVSWSVSVYLLGQFIQSVRQAQSWALEGVSFPATYVCVCVCVCVCFHYLQRKRSKFITLKTVN